MACSNSDGSAENAGECMCGNNRCDAGQFCIEIEGHNECSSIARTCADINADSSAHSFDCLGQRIFIPHDEGLDGWRLDGGSGDGNYAILSTPSLITNADQVVLGYPAGAEDGVSCCDPTAANTWLQREGTLCGTGERLPHNGPITHTTAASALVACGDDANCRSVYDLGCDGEGEWFACSTAGSADRLEQGCSYTKPILGCMDDTATNYNPEANVDNGSCSYVNAEGLPLGDGGTTHSIR